jgi:hypothetical protein
LLPLVPLTLVIAMTRSSFYGRRERFLMPPADISASLKMKQSQVQWILRDGCAVLPPQAQKAAQTAALSN